MKTENISNNQKINITFDYDEKTINGNIQQLIVISYDNKKLEINIKEESLNEISKINDFVLEKISENKEIKFIINEILHSNATDTIKKTIKTIVDVYEKEYKEIMKHIESFSLKEIINTT